MASDTPTRSASAPLVAIASWLIPGAGYWLIGQRARGLTVGITIVVLFVAGVLIGGVRLIDVPGYGDHGDRLIVSQRPNSSGPPLEQTTESELIPAGARPVAWVMLIHPVDEFRNKPWFVAQILTGPINLIAAWGSVRASHLDAAGYPLGARSHSRTNELGLLYTAVAGMLNLLAIIDATSRVTSRGEDA